LPGIVEINAAAVNPEEKLELERRILAKAGFKVGGHALARHLGVTDARLTQWLSGKESIPHEVFVKIANLLVSDEDAPPGAPAKTDPA
jgi:hypothetical protein